MVFGRPSGRQEEEEEEEEEAGMVRRDSLERAEFAADLLEVKWSTNLGNGVKAKNGRDRPVVSRSGSASRGPMCFGEDIVDTRAPAMLSNDKFASGADEPCCCSKQSEEGNAFLQKDVDLIGESGSVECGADRAQSFLHCQTTESSRLELNGSAGAECWRVSEVHSPNKSMVLTENEQKSVYLFKDRDGSDLFNDSKNLNITMSESVSSVDVHMIASDATANEVLQDIHEDITTMTEIRKTNISLETEEVRVMDNRSSSLPEVRTEADPEESTMVPKPVLPIANSDLGLHSIGLPPSKDIRREDTDNSYVLHVECVPTNATNGLLPEGSEEAQFVFSDLDSKASEVEALVPTYPDFVEKKVDYLVKLDGLEGVGESMTSNYESQILSDRPVLENLPNDIEKLTENTRMMSSAICIPSSCKALGGELGQGVRNLRNTWSHPISDVVSLNGPLSRSLDSNSDPINWTLLSKGVSNCLISDAAAEQNIIQEWPAAEGNQISADLQNILASGGAEISLCKHLLCKGMGAKAASQAFDSEKLHVDKLSSLSDITKDDRLVVRISNHYFPWNVAVPIILKMISLKSERLINPKGMIAVEEMENTLDGDPSKAIIARSGSWRIWPFERSNSKNGFQTTLNGSKISDAGRASENGSVGVDRDKDFGKMKVSRSKVRKTTPTSEQLASLKLNEGRNIVTFTFSTAVLGKQQVDARIYLWKWNTRIVISDVDGTITKSDVLGQFMPMVGVDWSHTGVTHLFSAIQENGYKMLFLSARAISQAYHTRQFLFNLKQNGKALPDGPVVISPDGVFPSLFREVIRRAPHEFKIACLEDIKALFPSDCNPFYAGFGNRDTDEISYLKVGIPRGKIFIINPKGEVVVNSRIDTKSYTSLHALVHDMFPSMSSSEQEDYNSWNFWKLPPPSIDL